MYTQVSLRIQGQLHFRTERGYSRASDLDAIGRSIFISSTHSNVTSTVTAHTYAMAPILPTRKKASAAVITKEEKVQRRQKITLPDGTEVRGCS